MAQERGRKRTLEGIVTSDKMQKTAVVRVERITRHPLYGKVLRRSTKFKVHDEKNECRVGDRVRIMESRPLSKDKHWRLLEIVERAR